MTPPTIDLPTLSAGLVEWVRSGGSDDEDTEPRLDRAAAIMAQRLPPEPEWWRFPCDMPRGLDPANFWPRSGGGTYRPIRGWGESAEYAGAADRGEREPAPPVDPPMDVLISRSKVTWKDILDSTYSGDTIAAIARRLDLDRSSLAQRLRNNPGVAARIDEKRGAKLGIDNGGGSVVNWLHDGPMGQDTGGQ